MTVSVALASDDRYKVDEVLQEVTVGEEEANIVLIVIIAGSVVGGGGILFGA
jgi:hypothetical protein